MTPANEIRFYRASEKPYGPLSNLYRRPVEFQGEVFATSEHAYQAGKARKPEVRKWLMEAPSPSLLAMAAHGLYYWDVAPGWSKLKFDRMRKVLAALADMQVAAWEPLLEGKSPRKKLERLKGLYLKEDPFMSVEERDGDLILVERNCPFLNVAMEHPALCSLSVATLERLLGHPVIREERFQAGHGRCVFRIKLGEKAPARDFRLESESRPA